MKYIESLREGERINEIYLCKTKQSALTKAGKPYENVILQDKTGYPYLKGAMLRGRLTDLLGLNLSINSLRNDWRVMNDNTIVAFATMELVIKDDMGNEVCRS